MKTSGVRYVLVYAYGSYRMSDIAFTTSDLEFSVQFTDVTGEEHVMHYQMSEKDRYYNRGNKR